MANVGTATSSNNIYEALNSGGGKGSTNSTSAAEDIQNRFLTLLVTQLRNQDPLNPMDNAAMTTQLSQISTVTGIEKLNTMLSSLVDSFANTQAIQATEMIGKGVLVPGSKMSLAKGAAYGGVSLPSAADKVTVTILNSAGTVVQTENLGAHEAGNFAFSWDGKTAAGTTAPDGNYTFKVEAMQGGKAVTAGALQFGMVSALVRTASGFQLDLGSLGSFDFKDVKQII